MQWVHTNPRLPKFLDLWGVRTVLQSVLYLAQLLRACSKSAVVHILAASDMYFFIRVAPAVVVARLLGKHVVLNYRGGAAPDFFARLGWLAWPIVRLANRVTVPSAYLERCFLAAGISCSHCSELNRSSKISFPSARYFTTQIISEPKSRADV